MKKLLLLFSFLGLILAGGTAIAQPVINYPGNTTANNYTLPVGTAITTQTPAATGTPVGTFAAATNFATITTPTGIVYDASSGGFYVVDYQQGNLYSITTGGTVTQLNNSTLANNTATGITVDGSGNIYVTDGTTLREFNPGGTNIATVTGFNNAAAVTYDPVSNLIYVADSGNGLIYKVTPGATTKTALGIAAFTTPAGIAIDGSGNIFVSQNTVGTNNVIKVANGTTGGTTKSTFASGFNSPRNLTTDAYGNVYVADNGNNAIKRISSGGTVVSLATGLNQPRMVDFDASGNMYEADENSGRIKEFVGTYYSYTGTLPPGLLFDPLTGDITGNPNTAGSYSIVVKAASTSGNGTVTVNFTCSVPAPSISYATTAYVITYGTTINDIASNSGGTATYAVTSGTLPTGLSLNTSTGAITGNPSVTALTSVTITATNTGGNSPATITFTVNKATLTITASTNNKTYGATLTGGTITTGFTYTGQQFGETVGNVTAVYGTGSAATDPVATYTNQITISAAGGGTFNPANYTILYNQGNIVVGKATLTITASTNNKTYGTLLTGGTITTGFTYTGQQNGETVGSVTVVYGTGSAANAAVATYTNQITISAAGGGTFNPANYTVLYNQGNIVVGKATLTITASTNNKTYGTTLNNGTITTGFTYTGQQNGETVGNVTAAYGTGAAGNAAVGTYTNQITISAAGGGTFNAANYTILYNQGNIVIGQATLTITASTNNKTYGGTLTGGTITTGFTYTGQQNGETVGHVTVVYGTGSAATDPVATYTNQITISAAGGGTFNAANYTILYNQGNIVVGKATLTITASTNNKTYGTLLTGGTITTGFTYTGQQNGETVGSVTVVYGTGSAANAAVATYTNQITISAAGGGTFNPANYTVLYNQGNIVVGKATLTITASTNNKTYGTTLTGGTITTGFTYSGQQNGETVGHVTAAYGTGAAGNAAVGTYTNQITISAAGGGTFNAANYTILYNQGNIVIGQATLTITASTNNKTYGTTLTSGTITTGFTYSGQQNGETVGQVAAVYGTGSAATDPVGTYTNQITISAASGGTFNPANYIINYNQGNIVVGQATLTITANSVTKTIGTTLTGGAGSTAFTYSGQQNGETVGTVTITYGAAGAAGAALGTYNNQVTPSAVTGGTFVAANYNIVYVSGSITVIDHPPVLAYNTPNVYPVNEAISTLSPNTSGGGAVIAPAFNNGTNLSVTPNFNGPQGMAFDASGNLYVVNNNGTIDVFNSSGASTGTFGSGLTNPVGMVFDASGNAYVLDATKNKIYEFNSGGTLVNTLSVTGLNGASAIAIDSSGNLYIANTGANDVLEVNAGTGAISKTITSNINAPTGIALDNSGNIYVSNAFSFGTFSSTITKYSSAGTYLSAFKTDFLGNFSALSIDASGNVYTADDSPVYGNVYQYSSTGTTLNTIGGGWNAPEGIIADTKGDVYVSDNGNNSVTEYNPTGGYYLSGPLPPGLSFSSTTGQITGTPTSVFPTTSYTVTAYNSGGAGTSNTFTISCYISYDWVGATPGGDWNTTTNWASLTIPGSGNTAKIGVDNTFTYAPVVSTTGATTVTVGAVQFGNVGGQTSGITVNTGRTLVVVGDITVQSDANSTMGYISYLSGAGTIQAVNLNVIANSTLASGYTEQIKSTITSLQLSGNIALTSTKVSHAGNAKFIVSGGVTGLTGTGATGIISTNNQSGATSTISVTAGTLQWANATGLSGLSSVAGTNVLSFTGTGVVGYSGGNQTVYTDLPVTGLTNGVSYQGISFSGTGIKTPNGTSANNLNIAGSFTNSLANDAADNVSLANTIVNFNGTTAQALAGGTASQTYGTIFNTVNFSNAGVKTMSGNFYVAATGTLTMSSSASLVAGDNATSPTSTDAYLTLLSNATNSAAIAPIVSGTSITGNVNVQRYISGIRGYRLISSPVYAGTANGNNIYSLNSLSNSLYLTGTGGGFAASGNPTLYLYDEGFTPQFTTFLNSNFIGIADISSGTGATPSYLMNFNGSGGAVSTSTGYNIPVGNGYYCFFRGNLSEGSANLTNPGYPASAATITATGNLTQGPVNFVDWYTPTSPYLGGISQNFNLVGNPYASAIDLSTVTGTNNGTGIYATTYDAVANTGITKFIYELNPVTNIYGIYTDDGSLPPTNGASQYIGSGQGFFVQAFGANNAQLVFNESSKATSTNANAPGLMARRVDLAAINTGAVNPLLKLKMSLDSVHNEETILSFDPKAHASYVFNEDAPHRTGGGLVGFSSMSGDNIPMSVNSMPLQQTQTIPLRIFATNDGIYNINLSQLRPLPALYEVWLKDAFTKDSLDIKNNPVYKFNIANADTSTYGAYRLSLVIRENPALMIHLLSFGASKIQGGDQVIWTTENEQNYTNFTVERSTDGGTTFNELEGLLSTAQSTYSYLDKAPANGPNMYRLKIVDLNGTVSYSNVVTIMYANTNGQIAINGMMVYPNPTAGTINLSITNNTSNGTSTGTGKSSYNIEIVNNLGSVIKSAKSSSPQWQSDVTSLTPGTYFIRVIDTGNNTVVGRSAFVKL